MSRVYLFNMMARDRYSDATRVVVNECASRPYSMFASVKANDYVPFSTSGALLPSSSPQDNAFVASNGVKVENASGGIDLFYPAVKTPSDDGDIIVLLFPTNLVLYRQSGALLANYSSSTLASEARRATIAMATEPGGVYVFNVFSEAVTLSSNGGLVATIPAWSDGTDTKPPLYTPSVFEARRVRNSSDGSGAFANGANRVTLSSNEAPGRFDLTIDGNRFPLNQSLWLVVARDHWILADQFGVVASQGPIEPLDPFGSTTSTSIVKESIMTNEMTNAGSVYVFNVTSQDLDLSTNGLQTEGGPILGWPQSGTDKYRPNVKAVARVLNGSDGGGKFFNGTNHLSLRGLDGSFIAVVKIDGQTMPLNQDLLLFVERNKWQLVTQYGAEMDSGDVIPATELRHALRHTAEEHA